MNKTIVDLWADIGSEDYWNDLIDQKPGVFCPFEQRWPQPGFIGRKYLDSTCRVVVMGQNPRGSNTPKAANADKEMFRLIRHHSDIRSRDTLEELFAMMRNFMLGIDYTPAWKPITAVRRHLCLELDNIAYLNLIPLATYQDQITPTFREAFCISTRLQLEHLAPNKIVVFGKGAYETFQSIGVNPWDVRHIQQRNYKDAPSAKKWLAS